MIACLLCVEKPDGCYANADSVLVQSNRPSHRNKGTTVELTQRDWEDGELSQSACNLSGLARSLKRLVDNKKVTDLRHPLVRLYVAQMVYLSHDAQNCEATPLPIAPKGTLESLVNGLNEAVSKAWQDRTGTEYVNHYPEVRLFVRLLCQAAHNGPDPFGWRWQNAYNVSQVMAGKNPYSNTEPWTEALRDKVLASAEKEEAERSAREAEEEAMRLNEAEEYTKAKELMEGCS